MSADRISFFTSSFGSLLRRYRQAAGLTQEELAARAGLSVRAISDLERGKKQTPRRETMRLLAEALALSPRKRALFEAAVRPLTEMPVASAAPLMPPHNLPAQLTLLIGREYEAQHAVQQLARTDLRLLTLTGTGGVGKTRLALQVAEEVLEHFEDGVYAVWLAPLHDTALALQRIAETLGLRPAAEEPLIQQLSAFLSDKQLLLVLDNFEHLLDAAPALGALLAACPRLKALVTSREPLKVAGEHELPVPPLAHEAARELFVRRARAVYPTFELRAAEASLVEAICQQVDCLPLALELAAVWVKTLPLPTLLERLERLDNRLDLLTSGRRDAPERQRTLRATIAWSEYLLTKEEQRLFTRLAVFAGGCTPEAVEAVCGELEVAEGIDSAAQQSVLVLLESLVEKNLLLAETRQEHARFWMLETIQDYALERLRASGEFEMLRRRHAYYHAQPPQNRGPKRFVIDSWDQRLAQELPNMRAALTWACDYGEAGLGLEIAALLGHFWYFRGAFDEGTYWLRTFLEMEAAAEERKVLPHVRVMALYCLVLLTLDRHDFDEAEALAGEGLELARQHHDEPGIGNMLTELGHVAEARGDLDGAMTLFEESLLHYRLDEQQRAEREERGDPKRSGGSVGRTLSSLGNLARTRGDYEQARRYLEESLELARRQNFSWAIASGLVSLGHVACEQSDMSRALALYHEALLLYQTLQNLAALAWCLEGLVVVSVAQGNNVQAAELCGAIASLHAMAKVREATEWPLFEQAQETAQQILGADQYAAAYAEGQALSLEQLFAAALAV